MTLTNREYRKLINCLPNLIYPTISGIRDVDVSWAK